MLLLTEPVLLKMLANLFAFSVALDLLMEFRVARARVRDLCGALFGPQTQSFMSSQHGMQIFILT